jgi:4a-hydroxytetrahydrobiopterin dehydratase
MNILAKDSLESTTKLTKKLTETEMAALSAQLPEWRINVVDNIPHLERHFSFQDFSTALAFANKVGGLADGLNHHPAILIERGKCSISWWTHSHGGLLRNDFIMAAKTDQLYEEIC